MSKYSVDSATVQTAAGKLRTTASNIATELGNARSTVTSIGGDWTGQARTRFDQLMQEWDNVAKEQQSVLAEIGVLLDKAGAYYAETDESVRRAFGS